MGLYTENVDYSNQNAKDQSPTWADYGRVAVSSAQGLDAQLSAGARYVHELIGAKDLAALDKTQEQISNIGKEQTLSGLSDEAHKRLEASITSGDFWSHPFSAGALKTTGMSAQLLASALPGGVVGGALRATIAAGAAGGAVNVNQVLDDIYTNTDALPDKYLQKQSELYRGLRTMFDEPEAREQYNHQILGAKPAINFLIGAVANAVGPAGMLARGGEGAVLGAAEAGVAKRMGLGAAEAGAGGGVQGGVANYTEQHAEMEGDLSKDFDREALVNAILEPTVIAGAMGSAFGVLPKSKGRGFKPETESKIEGELTPEVTPTSTPDKTGPAPSVGRTGNAPPPNESIPVGNPQSAPTRSEVQYPKAEAAKAVSKGKNNKPPPVTQPVVETIAPDQALAIAARSPAPETVTDRQTANEVAPRATAASVQRETGLGFVQAADEADRRNGITPPTQQVPPDVAGSEATPRATASGVQRETGLGFVQAAAEADRRNSVVQPTQQVPPDGAPGKPRAVEAVAPAKPRVLEDLSPRAQEVVAKARADQAAALKEAAAAEKAETAEPGEKHRTKAEKEKLASDADKAKAIFESSTSGDITFPRTPAERQALKARLDKALDRAEVEGVKIPTKVSDATPDHVVWLREAKDLAKRLTQKSFVGAKANEHITSFLGREASAKGGDFSVMRGERKAEGEAAARVHQGNVEAKAAPAVETHAAPITEGSAAEQAPEFLRKSDNDQVNTATAKSAKGSVRDERSENKAASPVRKVEITAEERAKYETKPEPKVTPKVKAVQEKVQEKAAPKPEHVFVIDQIDPDTGKFEKHVILQGHKDGPAAIEAYEKSFSDGRGFDRIGNIVSMSPDKFNEWEKERNPKIEASDQHELPIPEDVRAKTGTGPRIEKAPGGAYFRPVHTTTAREALSSITLPRGSISKAINTAVAARLKSLIGDTAIHIVSPEDMARMDGRAADRAAEGLWSRKTRAVYIRKDVFENKEHYGHVVLHELLHEAANDALESSPRAAEQVKSMMREVSKYLETAGDEALQASHYALHDEHEFISEALSNPAFQKVLSRIDMPEDLAREIGLGQHRTMWDGLVAMIRKWLGMPDGTHTLLEGALAQGNWLISQGRVETKGDWRPGTRALRVTPEVRAGAEDRLTNLRGGLRRFVDSQLKSVRQLGYTSIKGGHEFHQAFTKIVDLLSRKNQAGVDLLEKAGGDKIVRDFAEFRRDFGDDKLAQVAKVGFEASNYGVNLGKNADNTHLGKDVANNVQAKHHLPRLQDEFNNLPPEGQALLQKAGKFFADTQNKLSLQLINNVLDQAGVNEPGLAQRIHDTGLTDADREKFETDSPVRAINRIRGLKRLKGLYLPFRRYGDFVVNGRHEIGDIPKSATRLDDGRVVFTDPAGKGGDKPARDAALTWAEKHELTHTDTNKIYVDKNDHSKIVAADDPNSVPAYAIRLQDQHTEFHDSQAAAQRRADELRDLGLKDISVSHRRDLHAQNPGLMGGDMKQVLSALEKQDRYKNADKATKDALRQALTEAAVNLGGSTKIQGRFLQRRNVAGFSQDLPRVTAEYAKTSARYLAKLIHQPKIDEAFKALDKVIEDRQHDKLNLSRTELRNALDAAIHSEPAQERPGLLSKVTNRLLQVSRLDKLASPAFHIINAQEPWTTSLPVIGGRHGFASAGRALAEAYSAIGARGAVMSGLRDTFKAYSNDFGFTDYVKQFKDNLASSPSVGGDKARRYGEMLDYIRDRGMLSNSALFEVGKHADPSSNALGRGLDRADLMANQVGTAIESINRAVTALSAYELEYRRTGNHEASMHYALETTDKTMGDYSGWNSARAFKSPLGAVALQFKKFAQKTYYLLGSTMRGAIAGDREAAKQFAGLMVTHAVVAGAMGLPLEPFKVALMAANVFGITGYSWQDFEQLVREKMAAVAGKKGGEVLSHGLTRAIGVEAGARQGLDSLLTFGAPKSNKPNDLKAWLFDTAAGAPVGLLMDQVKMSQALMKGDFAQAAELAVPLKVASDVIKAARGTTPTTNDRGMETQRAMTPYEMGVRAIGFTPAAVAEQGERRAQAGRMSAQQKQERTDFETKWAAAKPYDRMLLWGRIEQWNRGRPRESQLTRSQLDSYVRNQAKNNAASVGGIRDTKQNKDILQKVSVYNN